MPYKTQVTVFHNPRCSKSRQALGILNGRTDCNVEVVEYLKTPPSFQQVKDILEMLQMQPREIMRSNEPLYKSENLDTLELSDDELIDKMIEHPILIERPIVVAGGKAVIGRPPDRVVDIL